MRHVSVVIPAHNEGPNIATTVRSALAQASRDVSMEVIVVDDGSTDDTADIAARAGARVLAAPADGHGGNPAAARNRGAAAATGDPILFLDADCTPAEGWLSAILAAHDMGATVVGGSLELPPGLSATARCDYYCGWYLVHPKRPAGFVPHHPPPNLSVRKAAFLGSAGFMEEQPFSYTNEERAWQAELCRQGHRIFFEPAAVAYHRNRSGFRNLLKRNYRWAYTAIESKSQTGAARMAWMYRHPRLLIAASGPLAFAHTGFIVACWMRAGRWEPLLMLPAILVSRFAYAAGMVVGGVRWLKRRGREPDLRIGTTENANLAGIMADRDEPDLPPAAEARLSVAICTRNRPVQLRRALGSLHAQTRPPLEILVIDNAPRDERARTLVEDEFPAVRYVVEPVPGLDFARNRALAEAAGEIVAFLDDDAVADPDWVTATSVAFRENPRMAICTGRVDALSLEHPGQRLFEANGGFARGNRRIRLPEDARRPLNGLPAPLIAWSISVGSGCCLAVRRRVISDLGGFDEALDLGPALPGGGDLDLLWRALEAGYQVVYEPAVHARHEHRKDLDAAASQILEHNRSLIAVLVKSAAAAHGRARFPILAFLAWRLAKPGVRLFRRAVGRDPLPARTLLRLWWSCWRGLGAYPAARRIARRRLLHEETR